MKQSMKMTQTDKPCFPGVEVFSFEFTHLGVLNKRIAVGGGVFQMIQPVLLAFGDGLGVLL